MDKKQRMKMKVREEMMSSEETYLRNLNFVKKVGIIFSISGYFIIVCHLHG